jgi:hypothetical protein
LVSSNSPRVSGQSYSGRTDIRLQLPEKEVLPNLVERQIDQVNESNEASGPDEEEVVGSPNTGEKIEEEVALLNEKNSPSGLRPES